MYYVYILTNKTQTVLYTGVINDLIRRIYEHKTKAAKGFTERYNVDILVYYEEYGEVYEALTREKQIKNYSRSRKESLINDFNPDWRELYDSLLG